MKLALSAALTVTVLTIFTSAVLAQAPQVVSTIPAQNELNVEGSTTISVTFDINMDAATINDSTFVVNARSTGLSEGTITYDGPTKTATFDPLVGFEEGEVVTVVLTCRYTIYRGSSHAEQLCLVV